MRKTAAATTTKSKIKSDIRYGYEEDDDRRKKDAGWREKVENMLNHSKGDEFFPLERKISFLFKTHGASLSCCRNSSVSLDISCRVTSIVIHRESNDCAIYASLVLYSFFFCSIPFRNSAECAEILLFISFNNFLRKVIRALEVCSAVPVQLCVLLAIW
jgi:hypothetical protein